MRYFLIQSYIKHALIAFFVLMIFLISMLFYSSNAQTPFRGEKTTELNNGASMCFIKNDGQFDFDSENIRNKVLFKGQGNGTEIYIREKGVSFVLSNLGEVVNEWNEYVDDYVKRNRVSSRKNENMNVQIKPDFNELVKIHRIDMDFINTSSKMKVIPSCPESGITNYYLPQCKNGILGVKSYKEIKIDNIYENIDMVFYGSKSNGFKYNIIVKPGGNVKHIKVKFSGFDDIKQVDDGLYIETILGPMKDFLLDVYQEIGEKKHKIPARFVIESKNDKEAVISFDIPEFNKKYPLIIDPWITYYSGSMTDIGTSIAADDNGNITFTGQSLSPDFPVSPGAFQVALPDIKGASFIVKMSSNGNRIFSTYFGGSNGIVYSYEIGMAISFDTQGNIYVAGNTASNDFPVGASSGNNVHQSTIGMDNSDAYLAKFNPLGARLWATFYGGDSIDNAVSLFFDKTTNSIVLLGVTCSPNNISTTGSLQPLKKGLSDAFIVKFSPAGNRLWGTYLGGSNDDIWISWPTGGISCDIHGNIFICGTTYSDDFPVLAGHQMTGNVSPGYSDAFITKINSLGTNIIWSSYYGGTDFEMGMGVDIDNQGNVIIVGCTGSTDNISTPGSFQPINHGDWDGFVVKFNNNGIRLWGTYIGGQDNDHGPSGVACDKQDNIVVAGDTYSDDFPVTDCAYQKVFIGSEDQFIASFKPDGTLICSGLLGMGYPWSPNNETMQTQCIAVYDCFVFLCAFTNCNYPVTPGAYQTTCGGGDWDAAVAKLYLNTCGGISSGIDFFVSDSICVGNPVNYTSLYTGCFNASELTYFWTFEGGTPAVSNEVNPTGIHYFVPGNYDVSLVVSQSCGSDTLIKKNFARVYSCIPTKLEAFNIYTPNSDGLNDSYRVKYEGEFIYFHMLIYNRWGRLMFETYNINEGWSCSKCSAGTYYYIIEAKGSDKKIYNLKGTVTLLK